MIRDIYRDKQVTQGYYLRVICLQISDRENSTFKINPRDVSVDDLGMIN